MPADAIGQGATAPACAILLFVGRLPKADPIFIVRPHRPGRGELGVSQFHVGLGSWGLGAGGWGDRSRGRLSRAVMRESSDCRYSDARVARGTMSVQLSEICHGLIARVTNMLSALTAGYPSHRRAVPRRTDRLSSIGSGVT